MFNISFQIDLLTSSGSLIGWVVCVCGYFCIENVHYFLCESCVVCHLVASSGTLLNPDVKPTYWSYAGLGKYAVSFHCVGLKYRFDFKK